MGIFSKRPLCLFCFCFIAASLAASVIEEHLKLISLAVVFVCAAILFILSRKIQKHKYQFIEGFIAILFVFLAVLESFLAIDLPSKRLARLESGDTAIKFLVVSKEKSSRFYTKYYGKLATVDGNKINEGGYLVLEYEADYSTGDRLLLVGDITLSDNGSSVLPSKRELEITPTIDKDLILTDTYSGFDVSIICARLAQYVKDVLVDRLDLSAAALSFGFLTGNTSMIDNEVIRDFRRTGLSHLLAVSGLHLSVILGSVELILKKLSVSKGKRCIVISILSLGFLALSGFSVSACRSVLMLLCAYLCYALSRERDTLTALSIAGALMLFISPSSVFEVSFWLSFLATLGIVLYGEVLSVARLERKLKKAGLPSTVRSVTSKISSALLVTLSANVFICIVFFIVFGEMSVIFPASNLIITPLGELYLILTLLAFLFGGIPFVGEALSFVTLLLSRLMTTLAAYFSRLDFSVVSLEFPFAGIIIYLATAVLMVMFIVKLGKKLLLVLPPIAAAAIFCVCLVGYRLSDNSPSVVYTNINNSDNIVIAEQGDAIMIDVSDGGYSSLYIGARNAHRNAITELDALLLTHYHKRHISSVDRLLGTEMVRSIYLPIPESTDELEIMNDLLLCAKDHGVALKTYKREDNTDISGFSFYLLEEDTREGSSKSIISFSLETGNGLLTYADASWHLGDKASSVAHFASLSNALILGSHGPFPHIISDNAKIEYPPLVISAKIDILAASPHMPTTSSELVVATEHDYALAAEFKFD